MKEKGVSTYALINKHKFSNGTLHRMKQGKAVTTTTIDDLCKALKCTPNDILLYVNENEEADLE